MTTNASLVDPLWELIDPSPDVRALFSQFNHNFFNGALDAVEVRWSPRMTLCAGICCYEGRGGLCSIRLSEPLLKLRPRSDLIETLLHEMIHAFLFVTENNRDRESHGPNFRFHMKRINSEAGTHISVYHTFHDEVANYQKHWWRCTGICRDRPPFYGFVKRAMNRAPGPNDNWWSQHQSSCSGQFVKIKEPEKKHPTKVPRIPSTNASETTEKKSVSDIRSFFRSEPILRASPESCTVANSSVTWNRSTSVESCSSSSNHIWPQTEGHILGGTLPPNRSRLVFPEQMATGFSDVKPPSRQSEIQMLSKRFDFPSDMIGCPVCTLSVPLCYLNEHLDACLIAS